MLCAGAGPAGSSAAYYLRQFAEREGLAINVTVFEKNERVGGRTLTVNVFDDPNEPVELGASIFVKLNTILFNATQEFELPVKEPGPVGPGLLGVWDGKEFVYTQDENSWSWWNY